MEICVLKFDKARKAEEALDKLVNDSGNRNRWAHEVGVIKRPLLGRISLRATYDDPNELHEGDLASAIADAGGYTGYLIGSLAGPMHARLEALEAHHQVAPMAKRLERDLLGTDDVKTFLPPNSSALILAASPQICDEMVRAFAPEQPEVMRRPVSSDVEQMLQSVSSQQPTASA